ncbi:MAG: class I SAM-dependent RNA methyltransferase, partial [Candidatus Methanomethylicota archaeon]
MTLDFIATTITGFEDIAAREVERLLGTKAEALRGKVFFSTTIEGAVKLNLWSRTLHK